MFLGNTNRWEIQKRDKESWRVQYVREEGVAEVTFEDKNDQNLSELTKDTI